MTTLTRRPESRLSKIAISSSVIMPAMVSSSRTTTSTGTRVSSKRSGSSAVRIGLLETMAAEE